jgi:DNA polymerase III delta prime subunit
MTSFYFLNVVNSDEYDWTQITISISGELINSSEVLMEIIGKQEAVQIKSLEITPNSAKLIELTEGIYTQIYVTLTIEGVSVFKQAYPLYLMAYDQWTGTEILPELLAAFVTPNHPVLSRILVNASKFLDTWTGESSLDEYQTKDPNRVRSQVAAVYEALRSESLVYCTPPASFEKYGQRVRLVDKVLTEKIGTCLDLTLLFASCLEAIGIRPLLVLLKGHIFVGAWLIEEMYSQTVCDDSSYLLKGCADGINEIVLVEATTLTTSHEVSFEDAVRLAEKQLKDEQRFSLFIDVYRCRCENVRALPQRIESGGVWMIANDGIEHVNATQSVSQLNRFDINLDNVVEETKSRQTIWERKLLDLSLRNNLISIRLGKKVIPFVSFEIDKLEDRLQAGENYQILPNPSKKKLETGEVGIYDSSFYKEELKELVVNDLNSKKIRSYLSESELQDALKFVYRTARTSLEENGANSLFLVLGLLKWYENKRSVKPRFAPILLLPVEIVRRGGTAGYVIRTRDEEIILNITLVEWLKQQYHINLSGLMPLPKDESGVDVRRIFSIIRALIREAKGWDVIEESMLGLFSFNKFVMWNDIHSNADKLKANEIVASLIENRMTWADTIPVVDARQVDRELEPANYAIPVDVDSSQIEAVIEAGEGKSFILHGPPGTGKSQTITNMIANILYKGKRVLFVAEKMAALSVVQNRLSKIGLEPFCLEMHSNKATKSHFLEQLQKATEVAHIQPQARYVALSEELFDRRKKLLHYMETLHRSQSSGFSLYECIANYLSVSGDEIRLTEALLGELDKEKLAQVKEKIVDLDTVFHIIGHPQEHPLRGLLLKEMSHSSEVKLQTTLTRYLQLFLQMMNGKDFFSRYLALSVPNTFDGITWLAKATGILSKLPILNKRILDVVKDENLTEAYRSLIASGQERDRLKNDLLNNFVSEVLNENAYALRQEWQAIATKWFIPQYFAKRSYIKRLRQYNEDIQENEIVDFLDVFNAYQRLQQELNAQSQDLFELFGFLAKKGNEKWDDMLVVIECVTETYNVLLDYAQLTRTPFVEVLSQFTTSTAVRGDAWALFKQTDGQAIGKQLAIYREFEDVRREAMELCSMELPQEKIEQDVPLLLTRWLNNLDKIRDWSLWCFRRKEIESLHFSAVIDYIEVNHKTGLDAYLALFKGVNHQISMQIIDSDESLQLFNGLLFEQIINRYKQLGLEFQELTQKELYSRLAARIPSLTMEVSASSQVGILKRNISNGGRGTSIRHIIDQIPDLLPKLCPCMLMSPISVAQYIDLNAEKFDVVIFDEASQMPTSEAVGAIARGRSLVVVGDPKQMPPTSFFSSSQVDEEEAEFDDMESILNDCLSISMPSRYLAWHYRSKHESLIAFSNSQYYDGRLYTFPSVDDRCSKVSLVRINGTYDKGHTRSNRSEAIAIVDDIIRRLEDPMLSTKSIGVVSFSQAQQNLIEDLLLEKLAKVPQLEQKAFQGDEPVFIKNLENVQGDERDVILFSVGYGPDSNGNVSMNFGPLNGQGGERRLNVAVSRARYEMVVFSTLRSEQIDLRRSKAKGVEGLKKFLEFAENGSFASTISHMKHLPQHDIVSIIAEKIMQMGYNVDTSVGRSEFKVDIAVVDPACVDHYLLGILCDGKTYYEAKTTRDREVVQPGVLNMLHWNIMRVWSVDWFENSQKVMDRIAEKLNELQQEAREEDDRNLSVPDNAPKPFDIAEELHQEPINDREAEYVFANMPMMGYDSDIDAVMAASAMVKQQLKTILSIEQPITNTLLYKRISEIWQLSRVTSRLQVMIDSLLTDTYKDPLSDKTRIYWENVEKSSGYTLYRIHSKRDILDIPIIEVMNAMRYVLEQQISLPVEDLKRVTSQVLGFSRKGTNLDAVTGQAVRILLEQGVIMDREGLIVFA